MKCVQTIECINDAIDGALTDELQRAFDAHLAECESCRAEYALMTSILTEASTLTASIQPDRDLWPGIELRIAHTEQESNVVGFPGRSFLRWAPLAAAAAVLLIALGTQLGPVSAPVVPPEVVAVNSPEPDSEPIEVDGTSVVLAGMEADYAQARETLLEALEARKDELPEDLVNTIEENLNIIENAVVDIHRALEDSPESPELKRMLHAAYRSEMTLLQTVVQADESES